MRDQILDQFADALIAVSPEGEVLVWSRGAETMFGYSRDEAIGHDLVDLIPPEQRDEESLRIRTALEFGSATFEAVRRRKDGSTVYLDVSMRAVPDAGGEVTHVAISMTDVSHLKVLREAVAVEARFRGLLETAADAMILLNRDGHIMLVNGQTERLFGYTRDELLGRPVEILVPERLRAAHVAHRARYARLPVTRPMNQASALPARRKDGSEFAAEISLNPLTTDDGVFVSSTIREVSARAEAGDCCSPDQVVLVVEDSDDDEELTLRALKKVNLGHRVIVARDGVQALEYLFGGARAGAERSIPALVLLDLNLPRVDGPEILRRLRGDERTRAVPVVVLASSPRDEDLIRDYPSGTAVCMRKPIDVGGFIDATRALGLSWRLHGEPPR
jgi:PAS domain S-box-containing protein